MKRKLAFYEGIKPGFFVRDIIKIIPQSESMFTQRKSFDEYYWNSIEVEIDLETISRLNEEFFHVTISQEEILIS
jgi:hypothetical protein